MNRIRASPRIVVIAGSTRGIGYGLAKSFLELGCAVTVSGRSRESTARAVEQLARSYDPGRVFGLACDVTVSAQVTALWEGAAAHFGRIDIWVNNAGYTGEMGMAWERARRIFNILAERVERVAPWLAQQMLDNHKSGAILSYSSPWKMLWKFLRSPFVKEEVFD